MKPPEASPTPLPSRRAVAYVRRSTDRQEQSLDDQRAAIRQFADRAGLTITAEYIDDAVSGSTSEARDGFQRLIADAQSAQRDFDLVLTYDIKRWGRVDTDEAGYYRFLLRKAGVEVVYVSEGFNGDDTDDLLRPVKQWQARQELKDLSKVTIRGQLSLSSQGWWLGGVPPFGYDLLYFDAAGTPFQQVRFTASGEKQLLDMEGKLVRTLPRGQRLQTAKTDHARLVPGDPERIAVVRRIFDLYANHHMGFKPIAHLLNSEKIASPRNGAWSSNHEGHWASSTIRAILVNPIYTGAMAWNRKTYGKFYRIAEGRAAARPRNRLGRGERNPEADWIVIPDTHQAIVSKETFEAAVALRHNREQDSRFKATLGGRAKTSPFLLSGLIRCSDCGHTFQGYRVRKGRKDGAKPVETEYYCCGGYITKGTSVCKRRLFPRAMFEDYVLERIGSRLERFLKDSGRKLLEKMVREELGPSDERDDEAKQIRTRLAEIKVRIDTLLDSLTPTNKEFVDEKLTSLKAEKDRLETRLANLETARPQVNVKAVVDAGIARLRRFGEFLAHGSLEEQKSVVRAFLARIDLSPREGRGEAHFVRFPASSSFEVVAGAGFEPATFGL